MDSGSIILAEAQFQFIKVKLRYRREPLSQL